MHRNPVLVYGAGGHAKVVIDILERSDDCEVIGVLDDSQEPACATFLGYPVMGGMAWLEAQRPETGLVLAVGDNMNRRRLAKKLRHLELTPVVAIHPTAQIGRDVTIGEGTVVVAGAVVNPGATVGRYCIVNTGATIDHECIIGDYTHICPGVHLSGNVRVGNCTFIGIGASVIQNITIGDEVTVGAGAAVIRDIPAASTVVGVPARRITPRGQPSSRSR